ncbi:uncharacterized protein RCC_10065 [Ramularia collo-cygni]|uniref:Uncharacterized protein n=1 Tax=Ramularia collo-cygni TaxID=112498 RepID=A0A2D3VGI8_9PEZI|nr:uncharacterized protein RCC_10065 [Ramularia collo-cygni]CZT24342.1 uncharacterized protein RCC_10065 [Ramularia collo-cygni]
MSNVNAAIGLVSGVLTITEFFKSNFVGIDPKGAKVSIKAGLGLVTDSTDDWGGRISAVHAYNNGNEYLGESDSVRIADGGFESVIVDQTGGGGQPGFISLANANDATCVQWVTVEARDLQKEGAWTGDIGEACGQRTFYGIERAGTLPNGDDWIPFCTWLDADGTDGTPSAAMKFRVDAYGEDPQGTLDSGNGCASTLWGPDQAPIAAAPAKRETHARPLSLIETLIMSDIRNQTAEWLCSQAHTWGPDFVGVDGKFCDMGIKQLSPLCSTEDIEGCVDIAENGKAVLKRSNVARREVHTIHKTYKRVAHNH